MSVTTEHTAPVPILFINLYTEMGGGEYGVYHLLKNMDRKRFHPVMMFNQRGPFVEKVEALGVETVIMPYAVVMLKQMVFPLNFWTNMKAAFAIRRYVSSRGIGMVQCSDVLSLLLLSPALIGKRIPVVYSVIFLYELSRAILFNVLAFCFVNCVVSLSKLVESDLLEKTYGLKKKSRLVYWGIDTDNFSPKSAEEKRILKERLGLPHDKTIVGCIGRYDLWKGHLTFLDAAEQLIGSSADTLCLMAGGTVTGEVLPAVKEYERRVQEKIKQTDFGDRLIVWGHRDDVSDIMACLDVFVCPSDSEPFGLVVLEALASGVRVVTGKKVGALEVIGNEKGVFVAEENTGTSFAKEIRRALDAEKSGSGVSVPSIERTLSRYSWPEYTRSYEKMYAEALGAV